MKKIVVIGSTGSIGRQTLNVIERNRERFEVLGLCTGCDGENLSKQVKKYRPKYVGLFDNTAKTDVPCVCGEECYSLAALSEADIVVIAASGIAALPYLIRAIEAGKRVALANKESIVACGDLLLERAKRTGSEIIPVDSEHSAIFQALACGRGTEVRRLMLTCSGGAFLNAEKEALKNMTAADALCHPTWNMGKKITVDSATLVNKGLEVIEANRLFGLSEDKIDVVVHPQSIIHSMVEFCDSAVSAIASYPDMALPIQYALTFPERIPTSLKPLDFAALRELTFFEVDDERFPALSLARKALNLGGFYPLCYSSANEVFVGEFLKGKIGFTDISDLLFRAVECFKYDGEYTVENALAADAAAREAAYKLLGRED